MTNQQNPDISQKGAAAPPNPSAGSGRVGTILVAIVLIAAVGVAGYSLVRMGWKGESGDSSKRFSLDMKRHVEVAPELIGFVQSAKFVVSTDAPAAVAVGPDSAIYVAGETSIDIFDLSGKLSRSISLEKPATCLAISGEDASEPGRIFVGSSRSVMIYGSDGKPQKRWPELGEKSLITAIAVAPEDVFVADAGRNVVIRYDLDGNELVRIGELAPDQDAPGFVIPSPYFDLVIDSEETISVVNPGARRIECYSFSGQLQSFWGNAGTKIDDFFGCCNPSHLAWLPDERFVTSEKGIPRIKVYSRDGDFETVVVDPRGLDVPASAIGDARTDQAKRIFDIAVAPSGDIVVLDLRKRVIRIFQPKPKSSGKTI